MICVAGDTIFSAESVNLKLQCSRFSPNALVPSGKIKSIAFFDKYLQLHLIAGRKSQIYHLFFVAQHTLGFLQSKTFSTLYEPSAFYLQVYGDLYEFCQGDLPFVFHFFSFFL